MSDKVSEISLESSEDMSLDELKESFLEDEEISLEKDKFIGEDIVDLESDSSVTQVVERPSINLNAAVERYWEETNYTEWLKQQSDGHNTTTSNEDLKLGVETMAVSFSILLTLTNPLAGLTFMTGASAEGLYRMKKNRDRRIRNEERLDDIENTYYFGEDADLTPVIENTEVFVPAETSFDVYMEGVEAGDEIREETDIDGYLEGTTQALWANERQDDGFDYQLEVHFDGVTMFRANGYAEMEDLDEILDQSDERSLSSLIFEYTDSSKIKNDNLIVRATDYISRRVSCLPEPY